MNKPGYHFVFTTEMRRNLLKYYRMNEQEITEGEVIPEEALLPEVLTAPIDDDISSTETIAPVDPLQAYINKIKQYPTLTREKEIELAKIYHETGDKEAAFRLTTANLMLVVKIAFEFRTQFQNMLDLVQEGNYGLMRAVQKFNPFKGTRLSTYSSYWIRAYILKYLLDNWRLVRVGTTNVRRKLLYNLREVEQKLMEGGQDVGPKLLAEHFEGATERDVIEIQQSLGASDKSIYAPVEEGSNRQLVDILPSKEDDFEEEIDDEQISNRFKDAIEKFKTGLKPSDLSILEDRILSDDPITLQNIGDKHSVTREAIRQAEGRLMKRLKEFMREELGDIGEVIS